MRIWPRVLALFAVLVFFVYSLFMLRRVLDLSTPLLALLSMFYLMALAKLGEPLFLLRMPSVLRQLRPSEAETRAYRYLAVPAYGALLRRTPLRYLNSALYLPRPAEDMLRVRLLAESAEASHFWAAVFLLPFIVFAWFTGQRAAAGWLLFVQVVVNLYPILHLRLVRARLDRAMRRRHLSHPATRPGSGG